MVVFRVTTVIIGILNITAKGTILKKSLPGTSAQVRLVAAYLLKVAVFIIKFPFTFLVLAIDCPLHAAAPVLIEVLPHSVVRVLTKNTTHPHVTCLVIKLPDAGRFVINELSFGFRVTVQVVRDVASLQDVAYGVPDVEYFLQVLLVRIVIGISRYPLAVSPG